MTNRQSRRSTLPRHEARRRYVEMGELAVLEQIMRGRSNAQRSRRLRSGPLLASTPAW